MAKTPLFSRKDPGGVYVFVDETQTTGDIFFVDSTTGDDTDNSGSNPDSPLATADAAVGSTTANKNDKLYLMPGHSETITAAGGLTMDVAGVSVIGLGEGDDRPTFNFSTSTSADIDIDAANITFKNIKFDLTGIDALVAPIDVNAADCTFENCEFIMADACGQAVECFLTDANADRLKIKNCIVRAPNAGANNFVSIVGANDGIEIVGNHIYGDFADACIHNPSGNVATNVRIENNYLQNDQTGDHAIELVSAVTGVIRNNMLVTDAETTSIDPGSCLCDGNKWMDSGVTDDTAVTVPIGPAGPLEWRLATKSVADMSTGWGTGDSPVALFTVTGDVAVWAVWGTVTTAVTSTSNTGTLEVGVTGDTTLFIGQDVVDATAFAQHDVYAASSADNPGSEVDAATMKVISGEGTNIIATVATNDMTAGAIEWYCIWAPVSAGSNVVAA